MIRKLRSSTLKILRKSIIINLILRVYLIPLRVTYLHERVEDLGEQSGFPKATQLPDEFWRETLNKLLLVATKFLGNDQVQ